MKSYHDIEGDGGSGIVEQVAALKSRIANSLAEVRHRVAVASGKGGVGKSTVTMQLASALARRGWRTAILDADVNGPCQARLAGLEDVTPVPGDRGLVLPTTRNGIGVLSLGSFLPDGAPLTLGSVAPDDSFLWRATQEFTALAQILAGVDWGRLDLLLVDLPPGAERTVQFAQFLGPETALILVTQPSALASSVVARSAAALGDLPNPILGYVLNMDGYACADCGEVRPLYPRPNRIDLGAEILGSVPFDPQLAALCDRGESISEHLGSAVSRPLESIAERLATRLEAA